MRTLARAVYDKLNRIIPGGVTHGFAHDADPATLYCAFSLGPSFGRQYPGTSNVYNVQYTVPVTVNLFGETDTEVADKLAEVVEDFEGGLTVGRHLCIRVDTVTEQLEEDPDLAEEGNVVWHGYAVFNVRLSRNYYESSSSVSSGSSRSASSRSASSVSASSSSSSHSASSASTVSASSRSASSPSASSASASSVSTSSWSSVSASSVSASSSTDASSASSGP